MYEAIRNDRPVPVTPEDGTNILRIIEAAYRSSQEKKVIAL
jgi:predicted dehydrogenase